MHKIELHGLVKRFGQNTVCDGVDLTVEKGQMVKQGDIVGSVGKTGRSTGPHLDIRLNWFDVKLDPATILSLN